MPNHLRLSHPRELLESGIDDDLDLGGQRYRSDEPHAERFRAVTGANREDLASSGEA